MLSHSVPNFENKLKRLTAKMENRLEKIPVKNQPQPQTGEFIETMKKVLKALSKTFLYEVEVGIPSKQSQAVCSSKSDDRREIQAGKSNATEQNDKKLVEAAQTSSQLLEKDKNKTNGSVGSRFRTREENAPKNNRRLFLGGIPEETTETQLTEVFEKYGKVTDVKIILDKETKKSKRYGFLEFKDEDSVEVCLKEHFVAVNGKKVEVKRAFQRLPKEKEKSKAKATEGVDDCEMALVDSRDSESTTGSSGPDMESYSKDRQSACQKLFEDYFRTKFTLQNLLQSDNVVHNSLRKATKKEELNRETELEKFLTGLHVSSEQESSDTSSDLQGSYSTDDGVKSNFSENNQTHDPSYTNKKFSQTESDLVCAPCNWSPSNRSTENFLSHYNTHAHKLKVKERFQKQEHSNLPRNQTHADQTNSQRSIQTIKQNKAPRSRKKVHHPNKPPSGNQKNQKTKTKRQTVLQEILSSMSVESDEHIRCKICEKVIPHAPDFKTLMANLFQHLQSKGHLRKINEFENSIEERKTCVREGKPVPAERVLKKKKLKSQNQENKRMRQISSFR